MEMDWVKLTDEALRIASTIISGLVLAYFGLRIYFRQKEYELVKQRYLEQSLDVVAGELEEATSVFMHNWARSLELVKELRDAPENFEKAHLNEGFLPFYGSKFGLIAHHRLRVLLGTDVFWEVYQLALSRHMALNSVAAKEIPHAISEFLADRLVGSSATDIVEKALDELEPMPSKSSEYALLHNAIQRIASELERSRLSFGELDSFAKKDSVRSIVKEIELKYEPDLAGDESADET